MRKRNPIALAAMLVITLVTVVSAQETLDRTKVPPPGKTPVLRVPTWTTTQLPNGATLVVRISLRPQTDEGWLL